MLSLNIGGKVNVERSQVLIVTKVMRGNGGSVTLNSVPDLEVSGVGK